MRTITTTTNVYTFDELSAEAYNFAVAQWRKSLEYDYIVGCEMDDKLMVLLEENDIHAEDFDDAEVHYSLSYSQGDGAMFTGNFIYKGMEFHVAHFGRYYHENSKTIHIMLDDEDTEICDGEGANAFNTVYVAICKKLESYGYMFIDDMESEDSFDQECEANGYEFTSEGVMVLTN